MTGRTILCAAKLQRHQLERHLEPLAAVPSVERILLVRHEPIGTRLAKVEHVGFTDRGTARNTVAMFRRVNRTLREQHVDWVVGLNPLPWGLIAAAAAARYGIPIVLSLLGTDHRRLVRPIARPLTRLLDVARVITVPGERMRRSLAACGVPADRIFVLPHGIDTERFRPSNRPPDYDVVFVGQLIPIKRVDVLIDALAMMRHRARVAIVGTGPLHDAIAAHLVRMKLSDTVELLGFRDDVEEVVRRGRIFVMCSESEGLPFAMIEAMASGLVPVVTAVGSIPDVVTDRDNGRLLPPGSPALLASTLDDLLADPDGLARLRERALAVRETHSLRAATRFWSELFELDDAW